MRVSVEIHQEYMDSYGAWLRQLEAVHAFFFEDATLTPDKVKGLLNREANAKMRYDLNRAKMLGLSTDDAD